MLDASELVSRPISSNLSTHIGPFELTKLSAQVSVLMANQKNADPQKQAIALSYHNKGTFKTLANIVRHRGFAGMYTGLNLHLCKIFPLPYRFGHLANAFIVRDTLGTGIYFATYESGKQLLTTFSGKDAHKNPIAVLAAGALCGIVSWAMICMCLFTLPMVIMS